MWEPQILDLFEAVGNDLANSVWEARRVSPSGAGGEAGGVRGAIGTAVGAGSSPESNNEQQQQQQQQQQAKGPSFWGLGRKDKGRGGGRVAAGSTPAGVDDSWVWDDDVEGDGAFMGSPGGAGRRSDRVPSSGSGPSIMASLQRGGGAGGGVEGPVVAAKPTVSTQLAAKATYIKEKYVARRYVRTMAASDASEALWEGVAAGDLR